jgi:pyrroline-5-carboxylate reductase
LKEAQTTQSDTKDLGEITLSQHYNFKHKLGIIGAGNMAGAILSRTHEKSILVCDKDGEKLSFWEKKGFEVTSDIEKLGNECEYILLAVKPQAFHEVAKDLKNIRTKGIISVMAGVTIEKLSQISPHVARVMPNTPCKIGRGISAVSFRNFDENGRQFVLTILKTLGEAVETTEEKMNVITALSGSGPAYVFYFLKALTEAGIELGLTEAEAFTFAKNTFLGSSEMAEPSLDTLISEVASKGGTTEAAIKYFKENNLSDIIKNSVKTAKNRADELSKL